MNKYTHLSPEVFALKKIAVIPNHTKDVGLHVTKRLISALEGKADIYMNKFYQDSGLSASYAGEELYELADCVIVIGGDGTILQAAEPCARRHIPIMGINMGRIGFMTEIEKDEIEAAAEKLLRGEYKIEERMMMKVSVCKSDGNSSVYYALNDAVISKSNSGMLALEIYSQGEKINEYIADGLILSTPTGSTAYSLSAGGPVADPTTELFIATPICAHMLSSRCAILSADKKISVRVMDRGSEDAIVTVDGQIKEHITHGECVEVKKSADKIMIIKMGNQSFYDIMIQKL